LLNNSTISPKDNFFLAGGHSLLGMQLIMRVRDACKVDLTARELFDGPTVEQLSTKVERKLLQTRLARIWKDVLKIDNCGSASLFTALAGNDHLIDDLRIRIASEFGQYLTRADLTANDRLDSQVELLYNALASEPLLPPGGYMVSSERQSNNMFWLHYPNPQLAEAMGPEFPLLCLTLTKQDFETLGETPTLIEIARCFVPKILASQPKGPYIIGGFCLGGIVAYEVACQLKMAGYDVALLVLLDVPSPEYYRPAELRRLVTRPVYVTRRFKQLGVRKSLARLFERASEKILIKAERALVAEHSVRTQEIMEDAAYRYKPTRYEGKVALIMASERRPNSPPHEHFLPWWRTLLANNLHEHVVDAMHLDLVDGTAVYEVAEAIFSHLKTLPFLPLSI
jgi:thioesterase domain-containing protein/acyl carrier protein